MTAQEAIRSELDQAEHETKRAARRLTAAVRNAEAWRKAGPGFDPDALALTRGRLACRCARAYAEAADADARLVAARAAVLRVTAATFAADVYQDHKAPGLGPVAVS